MNRNGPRILLIGGTYRALCVLERLLERGNRIAAFIGLEGQGERDFCPEILEICDRASIPARSGHKLGEEVVRWLEDRIRPELAILVGNSGDIPIAIGGNCRLGLLEVDDLFSREDCPGITLRQRGQPVVTRELDLDDSGEEASDAYMRMMDELIRCLDEWLDQLERPDEEAGSGVPFAPITISEDEIHEMVRRPEPGPDTERLEREAAAYLGADHVFALRSARDAFALLTGILGLDEERGVICPGIASGALLDALRASGARVALADVDPTRLTVDPERVSELCLPGASALVISHPFGQPAEIDHLYSIASQQDLEVIEDGCAALGARFGDSRLGRSPCTCVFQMSFGSGIPDSSPALVTLPDSLAERFAPRAKELRLGDGAAAIARRLLETNDDRIAARREAAREYSSELSRYDAFRIPPTPEDALSVYGGYALRLTRYARTTADDLHKLLAETGIETRRIRLQLYERDLATLPCTETARATGLLLPVEPELGSEGRERLLDAIFGYAIG